MKSPQLYRLREMPGLPPVNAILFSPDVWQQVPDVYKIQKSVNGVIQTYYVMDIDLITRSMDVRYFDITGQMVIWNNSKSWHTTVDYFNNEFERL